MTGTIRRTIATGLTKLKITAMQVNPNTEKDNVSCSIEAQTVTSDYFKDGIIVTDTTAEGVECTKPSDVSVRVSFGTDGGSLEWVEMPSVKDTEAKSLEELSARLTAVQQKLELADSKLVDNDAAMEARILSSVTNLGDKVVAVENATSANRNYIRTQKFLIVAKGYSCDGARNTAPIACPSGYTNSGAIFYNTWSGGSCGQGSVFNICVQD